MSKTQQMRDLASTTSNSISQPLTASRLAASLGWFRTAASGATYPNSKTARRLAKRFVVEVKQCRN